MGRFLFATWEGGGHVQPMLLAAQGLAERGHQVLVVSDACNQPDAEALGLGFQPWRIAPSRTDRLPSSDPLKDWLALTPKAVIEGLVDGIMCGPAETYALETAEIIDRFAPDVVITHELMFGVMVGAEARGTPLAIFTANVWSLPTLTDATPFGAGVAPAETEFDRDLHGQILRATRAAFQVGLPRLNQVRAQLGLAPLADLFDQLDAAARILLATSRAFDFECDLPESFRYVGPYLADPAWARDWTAPWPIAGRDPLVLASFSTMYQGQEGLLERVIEALGRLPVRGLVTLGPALSPEVFSTPANVAVLQSAPHSQLYPIASVVVTHAGHGACLRPLMDGAPLLCIPLGRDQPDNAARAVERGAALRLAKDASVDDITAAVRRLLEEPAFRAAARRLGAQIVADAAKRSAEDELEAMLPSDGASKTQDRAAVGRDRLAGDKATVG
ncbi:MAG: glycosyltransferase [Caulobacterales bacterium]